MWLFVDEPKRGHADQLASSAALAASINGGGEENRSESGGDTSSQLPAIPEHPHFVNDMDVGSITNEASYLDDLRYLIKMWVRSAVLCAVTSHFQPLSAPTHVGFVEG